MNDNLLFKCFKVNFDESMNSLSCSNQKCLFYFDAIQNAYIANHSYKKLYGILVQFVNCMILYMPHIFFHEHKYNSKK